ncbi:hypothetical protein ABT236_20645 [Streptomyces sp. NPDC001523]|uniref:hypothetical protein n=1 Tax=Streptomyces sp. NPDC001523 TaxID=3154383 RepID=UPI003322FB9E
MTSPAPAPPPPHTRPAPWVRTRLRAAPLTTLLGAVLAFVAVLLAAGLPRALDRGSDRALQSFLRDQGPGFTSLLATAQAEPGARTPEGLDSVRSLLLSRTGKDFAVGPDGPVSGTRAVKPRTLTNPGLPSPYEVAPQMSLLYLRDLSAHTRLVDGRWPDGGTPDGPIPIALSQPAADTLGVKVGTVLDPTPSISGPLSARIVGVYRVDDPADPFWTDLLCATRACLNGSRKQYWQTSAVVGPDGADRLASWGERAEFFWRLPVDTDVLRADRLPAVKEAVASYVAGPTATDLTLESRRPDLRITSRLPELLARAEARRQAAAPLAAIGPAGVVGVALVVFLLAAGLGGDRRLAELRLLLARGGSRSSIVRRVLAEGAVPVLPAAALATAAAVLLLPTPRLLPSLLAASAVTLVLLTAFPVRVFVLLSPPRPPARRRRLVAELLVFAATGAAVFEVRERGVAPAGQGVDPLLVAAPLLLALAGGLLLARIQPPLVGALARAVGRRRGVVGFLGATRAARGSGDRARPPVLPLLALLLAVTTGGFGATVLAGVESARERVARLDVGGDAQVASPAGVPVPKALAKAAGELPGVRASLTLWADADAYVFDTDRGSVKVTVIVADPVAYAEIARTVGRGRFDPALLAGGSPAGIPALFSEDLVGKVSDATHRVRFANDEELLAKPVARIDGTPLLQGSGKGVIVLPAGSATARIPKGAPPTHWLAVGSIDDGALREVVRTHAGPAADRYLVRTSAATVAKLADDPLQRSASRVFRASLAGAAGFAVLAVLLTLARATPERAALLARLRTMGLRPRQGMALILVESLPQAVTAALGGGLIAVAAVALLGPAVDLTTLVGSSVPTGLGVLVRPVLVQSLGLAALVALTVLAEAAVSGRRQITTELRAGDRR